MATMRTMCAAYRGLCSGIARRPQTTSGLIYRHQPLFNFNAKNSDSAENKQQQWSQSQAPLAEEQKQSATADGDANANQADSGVAMAELNKTLETLQQENVKLLDKVKEIDDKFKRALAETENQRLRLNKQISDAKIFAVQGFCKDLLDVSDVLTIAIDTADKSEIESNTTYKQLFDGVQMTEQQLQGVFRRHGLTKINPIGEKFNPNDHNALFIADDPSKEPGTVAVVQKIGYKLHERTIRPAAVGVVKAK